MTITCFPIRSLCVAVILTVPSVRHSLAEQSGAALTEVESLGLVVSETPFNGLLVAGVAPASPAQRSGMAPGDFLLKVNDAVIKSAHEFRADVANKQDGTPLKVTIWRGGRENTLELTVANEVKSPIIEERAWLGIGLEDTEGEGAVIAHVYPSSPAARAGLRIGDFVLKVEGQEVNSTDMAASAIKKLPPNVEVRLTILRGKKEQNFIVKSRGVRSAGQPFAELIPRSDLTNEDRYHLGLIPEHAMRLEMHRRLGEQHERIESLVRQLSAEVKELRQEVRQLSETSSP